MTSRHSDGEPKKRSASARRAAASSSTGEEAVAARTPAPPPAAQPLPVAASVLAGDLLENEEDHTATFEDLGLCPELALACHEAGWANPTRIQVGAIPVALSGRDLVGVAQTGSGKTGAFVLPVIHWLLQQPTPPFLSALILVPTRELATQVAEQCTMLGQSIGLRVVTLLGGVDMVTQAVDLAKRPHVVVGTPGRVKDHFTNTKGFHMRKLRFLVMDEADKMLDMDYEKELDSILACLPRERQTLLFSATLSAKIDRLQKASLKDPQIVEVHRKNSTVDTLQQYFIFSPFDEMLVYLHLYLVQETGCHIIIFCSAAKTVSRITVALRILGHRALPLMGKMTQDNRQMALRRFKEGHVRILVATDLAQRGLDIATCDVVVNFGLPNAVKEYIHRVGRTARAGQHGKAVNIISQYDVLLLKNIEKAIEKELGEIAIPESDVRNVMQRVEDAEMEAKREVREAEDEERLAAEEQRQTGAKDRRRVRSGGGESGDVAATMGLDDSAHAAPGFAALRMRRTHEAEYGTTKKRQREDLRSLRRDR